MPGSPIRVPRNQLRLLCIRSLPASATREKWIVRRQLTLRRAQLRSDRETLERRIDRNWPGDGVFMFVNPCTPILREALGVRLSRSRAMRTSWLRVSAASILRRSRSSAAAG